MLFKNDQFLPDFLIIGAGKSGTTSLDQYLSQHPDIFMSGVKEPNFFAYELNNEDDFSDISTKHHFRNSITTLSDYVELFKNADSKQIIGETSNTYMYMPNTIPSIQMHLRKPKFIAILRQPAERIFSRYTHLLKVNKLPSDNFEIDLFDKSSIWWKRPDLIQEGFYAKHLKKYFESFPSEDIKVVLFDDFKNNPAELLNEITDFLKVNRFPFDIGLQYNQSGKIKNKYVDNLIGHRSVLFKKIQRTLPALYKSLKQSKFIYSIIEKTRNNNLEKVHMTSDFKKKITHEIYHDDIKALENLIQKNLSHWF